MSADVTVVRSELAGREDELRELLFAYFEAATAAGREWFDDPDWGGNLEAIVTADLDRLGSAALEAPLFLALRDDAVVGSVQLRRLGGSTAEVKRLYVRPEARGRGIGRALAETVLAEAAADGFEALLLGVAPYHERAQALYRDLGFEFRPPYEETQAPPEIRDDWSFMERTLVD